MFGVGPQNFEIPDWFQVFYIPKSDFGSGFLRDERSLLILKLPGAPPELWALQKSAEQRLGHFDKDTWKTGKFIWHSKFPMFRISAAQNV